jgi:hypothetical protein
MNWHSHANYRNGRNYAAIAGPISNARLTFAWIVDAAKRMIKALVRPTQAASPKSGKPRNPRHDAPVLHLFFPVEEPKRADSSDESLELDQWADEGGATVVPPPTHAPTRKAIEMAA